MLTMSDVDILAQDHWLALFHAGSRRILKKLYNEHFCTVEKAAGKILPDADKETVIHEVFLRIFTDKHVRENFRGGSLVAWLTTITKNQAIDFLRRTRKEFMANPEFVARQADSSTHDLEDRLQAKMLIDIFRRDHLPGKWSKVFEARFIRQLSQREVARDLNMPRTTVAYQEHRIRTLLRRFLESGEEP
jgi:RNA polymerase sigma-70 factor (ECF subfamily)